MSFKIIYDHLRVKDRWILVNEKYDEAMGLWRSLETYSSSHKCEILYVMAKAEAKAKIEQLEERLWLRKNGGANE